MRSLYTILESIADSDEKVLKRTKKDTQLYAFITAVKTVDSKSLNKVWGELKLSLPDFSWRYNKDIIRDKNMFYYSDSSDTHIAYIYVQDDQIYLNVLASTNVTRQSTYDVTKYKGPISYDLTKYSKKIARIFNTTREVGSFNDVYKIA